MRRVGVGAAALSLVLVGCGEPDGAPEREPARTPGAAATSADVDPVLAAAMADGVRRPANARQLLAQIRASEEAIADPATEPEVLEAAGRVQQVAYRVLGDRPAWDRRVLSRLEPGVRATARANIASRREFAALQGSLSDTLPAWRIVEPAPADELLAHYREAQRTFGVDWRYLAAINLVETGMGRIRGTSVAGARGPMQFIPPTWAQYGRGDIDDPRDAILAAGRYLADRGFTEPGGVPGALYAYNNHPAYVRAVTQLAETMRDRPRTFRGYYHWEIYYRSTAGDVLLPVGYQRTRPLPVARYVERFPGRVL